MWILTDTGVSFCWYYYFLGIVIVTGWNTRNHVLRKLPIPFQIYSYFIALLKKRAIHSLVLQICRNVGLGLNHFWSVRIIKNMSYGRCHTGILVPVIFPTVYLEEKGYTNSISEAIILNNDQHQHQKIMSRNSRIVLKIKQ